MPTTCQDILSTAQQVIRDEAQQVLRLEKSLDDKFLQCCELILNSAGRVIVLGMGKSGHIGGKIAATLASTGTPAFFVHPAEASHGDLGMITAQDITLLLSYSGETQEIISILPALKRLQVPSIAITGQATSTLARYADIALSLDISHEACPLGLAPTSSSTATLVLGDALAVALLSARGFDQQKFAATHPGGSLGRRLLLTVQDLMRSAAEMPCITESDTLGTALLETTRKGLGLCCITNQQQHLLGIFTDGDLRRTLQQNQLNPQTKITELMTHQAITVTPEEMAASAMTRMEQHQITALPVVAQQRLVGIIHMHDLLKAKII